MAHVTAAFCQHRRPKNGCRPCTRVATSVAPLATTVLMSWETKEYKIGGVVQSSSSVKHQIDGDPDIMQCHGYDFWHRRPHH